MVEKGSGISIRRQAELLSVSRSRLYYRLKGESEFNLEIMDRIDREFTDHPFTGVEKMRHIIRRDMGLVVNHKRVRRLMRLMGLMAVYPKPRTTESIVEHAKYPCLIREMEINRSDQVWCSDITYIRIGRGFMYLAAIMDFYSRRVLAWRLSNSLDSLFCIEMLEEALAKGSPEVFHSDQGRQYTCAGFVEKLKENGIKISMSGRGRAFDNILVERLWRTVKYEEVYLREYSDGLELSRSLRRYFDFYNKTRLHQSLGYLTPREAYEGAPLASAPASSGPPRPQAERKTHELQLTP
jgi:putative transposase